jgi:DNA-binding transcriptional MerR regulator
MGDTYSIGDLSREFGVTTRTIRHYEDEGLLAPAREGQNRIYSARDRVHLKLILRGELYDAPDGEVSQLEQFIDKMGVRRETLLKQREDIDRVLEELDGLERRCSEILRAKNGAPA